jgi:hypothetical protein
MPSGPQWQTRARRLRPEDEQTHRHSSHSVARSVAARFLSD